MPLTLIDRAIEVAALAHKCQTRKGKDVPYVSHPYAVGMLLMKDGCPEEVILAGLLHDTVEDTDITLEYIREYFGEKVASIVQGCSEPDKSLPWEERKRHTLEYLKNAPDEVKLVVCADKLYNIREIASGYHEIGNKVWERFKRGRGKQEWYYKEMVKVLCSNLYERHEGSIFHQLKNEADELFGASGTK